MAIRENPIPWITPWDEHNRRWVSCVRPQDYKNPLPASCYNLVVIGAGPAGLVAAAGAAGLGAKVALVERHLLGGDCLNVGCVPSKALLSAARVAAAVRNAAFYGVKVPDGVRVDFPSVMERMRRLRSFIASQDSVQRLTRMGVDVFFGSGRFVDGQTVDVEGRRLRFKKALIATGARAAAPSIPGLNRVPYLTNETLFSLTELPRRFGVIGAGPVGCEMAQAFARFGASVFLVEAMDNILPREDPEASTLIREALEEDGVEVLCGAADLVLDKGGEQGIFLRFRTLGRAREISLDKVLVAVGRAPNVEGLDLDRAGVAYSKKGVQVDDRLRTTNPRVYAAGDVCSPYPFTHAADFMARLVIRNALFFGRTKASALTIPWCTYTDPEIARVGLCEKEAEERGMAVRTFSVPLADVDRAVLDGRERGLVRVHVRRGTDRILGATLVAADAGNMIAEVSLAMTHKVGLKGLAAVVHPYPTLAEALRKAADLYHRSRLTPLTTAVLSRFMALRRR